VVGTVIVRGGVGFSEKGTKRWWPSGRPRATVAPLPFWAKWPGSMPALIELSRSHRQLPEIWLCVSCLSTAPLLTVSSLPLPNSETTGGAVSFVFETWSRLKRVAEGS
jgi:hypothetical protein